METQEELQQLHAELDVLRDEVLSTMEPFAQYLELKSLKKQEELDHYYGIGEVN